MSACRALLAGLVMSICAVGAAADTGGAPIAPVLRSDAVRLAAEARMEQLSQIRPETRPLHMVRVPPQVIAGPPPIPVPTRQIYIPDTQWDHIGGADSWTTAALSAIRRHGGGLEEIVPADIETWCPAYATNPPAMRRAFWVGMMSALAYHESRYRPGAVGGGGQWYGLLQVYPPTARQYRCDARTGEELMDPHLNLSCSIRIMARQIPARGTVSQGMLDWGPFHSSSKRDQMAAWTREQDYCRPQLAVMASLRPQARPEPTSVAEALAPAQPRLSTMGRPGG